MLVNEFPGIAVTGIYVSTAVPAFNEGGRLSAFLCEWAEAAVGHPGIAVEIIVVDDGSGSAHESLQRRGVEAAANVLQGAGSDHRVRYLRAPSNQGKGARSAWDGVTPTRRAQWLGFIDADGAVPAREFWRVAGCSPARAG